MSVSSKFPFAALALLVSTTAFSQTAAPAAAPAPEPSSTLAFNVGAVSEYRFRGMAQTSYEPALQAGVDYTHKSGLYVGAWFSNVSWVKDYNQATTGSQELDLYGGYKADIKEGLSYDIGVIRYSYPGNNSGKQGTPGYLLYTNADTTEFYGALTSGITTVKYSQSVGDFLGNIRSNGSSYIEIAANFDMGKGYTLTPHFGHQSIPGQSNTSATTAAADYSDASLTLAKDFGNGIVVSGAAIATSNVNNEFWTDTKGKNLGRSTVLLGVKYTF